jgi:hypothetical protein
MLRLIIIFFILFASCNSTPERQNNKNTTKKNPNKYSKDYKIPSCEVDTTLAYKIDTIFVSKKETIIDDITYLDICNMDDKYKIKPKKIVLGEIDHITEGFIWKNDTIIIRQPYADESFYIVNPIRKVYINGKEAKITRVIVKDIDVFLFFNNILLDYYYLDELYYKDSKYILREQPMRYTGKNKQKFVLVIVPEDNKVFELFIE